LDRALKAGIQAKAFPGAVGAEGDETGVLYMMAHGHFTYSSDLESNKPMTADTLFDVASVTKVLATTNAVATLYQRGQLDLHTKISDIFPAFAANGKRDITVEHCLLHTAGFPPDPVPNFEQPSVGCEQSQQYYPELSFSCQERLFHKLMNQTLQNPIGKVYVYSDISMMTLANVVGQLAKDHGYVTKNDTLPGCPIGNPNGEQQCYYEAYVRKHILQKLGMKTSGFLPSVDLWNSIPPLWNDTSYRHKLIQGFVSDENAYAMGGIAGHAGLFSSVSEVAKMVSVMMFEPETLLNATTLKRFSQVGNLNISSRALGWDTMMDDPTEGACGTLSRSTLYHTGYSGTLVCMDPVRKIYSILFTNRGYPEKLNFDIKTYRYQFNAAVKTSYDKSLKKSDIFVYVMYGLLSAAILSVFFASLISLVVYLVKRRNNEYNQILN